MWSYTTNCIFYLWRWIGECSPWWNRKHPVLVTERDLVLLSQTAKLSEVRSLRVLVTTSTRPEEMQHTEDFLRE